MIHKKMMIIKKDYCKKIKRKNKGNPILGHNLIKILWN